MLVDDDSEIKHYEVLKHSCMCGIDDLKHLSLFKLKRNKYDIKDIKNKYYFNWQYHASFSPLWSQRIRKYKGYPDFSCQKIIFIDDELEEEFYYNYGYEPDEQILETQNKSIMKIDKEHDWKWFYGCYKNNGIVLELPLNVLVFILVSEFVLILVFSSAIEEG